MTDTSKQGIKLFYCYAHEDKLLRDALEKHLSWLKRHYQLTNWHDREILPGEEGEQAIDLVPNRAEAYYFKRNVLSELGRYEDARASTPSNAVFTPSFLLSFHTSHGHQAHSSVSTIR